MAKMILTRSAALVGIALAACAVCPAQQQKFPLRASEWEVSTMLKDAKDPLLLRICLNDDLWTKALSQNPSCTIQGLNVSSKSVNYLMDCTMKTIQMKGKVELTFDGKEHMSGKASIDSTVDGKVSSSLTFVDYRWKAALCGPADVNLKPAPAK